MSSQGKRVKLLPKFRASLEEIFADLSMPSKKGKIGPASMVASDIIGIGDSWLSFAIKKRIIEPMKGVEDQDWYKGLSDKWEVRTLYLYQSSFQSEYMSLRRISVLSHGSIYMH